MRPSPKALGIAAVAIVIVGLLALLAMGLANRSPVTERSGITRVHRQAPEFTLSLLDGRRLALTQSPGAPVAVSLTGEDGQSSVSSRSSGQPLVINFWASWCPPCRQESPALERTWRSHRDEVLFIGVDTQDTEAAARAYLKEFDITYPNGMDLNGAVNVAYGVIGLPVTFFVDREGIVQGRWVGAISEAQLATRVEALVTGDTASAEIDGENLKGFFRLE